MRVEVHETVSVDVETEVDVSVDVITTALVERVEQLRRLQEIDRPVDYAVKVLLNACHQCLKAVTDEMIAEMGSDNRTTVYNTFQAQADRYR